MKAWEKLVLVVVVVCSLVLVAEYAHAFAGLDLFWWVRR